jgi:hypothetical protein
MCKLYLQTRFIYNEIEFNCLKKHWNLSLMNEKKLIAYWFLQVVHNHTWLSSQVGIGLKFELAKHVLKK